MPFLNTNTNMNSDKKNKNKRPYKIINLAFPPAKYGVYIAILIISTSLILLFFK